MSRRDHRRIPDWPTTFAPPGTRSASARAASSPGVRRWRSHPELNRNVVSSGERGWGARLLDAIARQFGNGGGSVKLRGGLSLERRQQQFRVRGWANACCRCEYAMFRVRGAVVMRPVPAVMESVVIRVGAMQQLRRESVRTNLKAERPFGRRHEARRNQRANRNGYQQQADEPLTLNATEETVVHGAET